VNRVGGPLKIPPVIAVSHSSLVKLDRYRDRLQWCLQLLLDRGADPNLGVEGDGAALIAASREGALSVMTLLLDRGANIELIVPGDENALINAAASGHLDAVKLLVARGANVNSQVWVEGPDGKGTWRTPLSEARRERQADVAAFLAASGARD